MHIRYLLFFYLFLFSVVCQGEERFEHIQYASSSTNRFGYIAIDQRDAMISESTWLYVKTALDYYKENPPVAIILHLNTPGGQVFAAQKIGDALYEMDREFSVPVIAYIDNWAISAGAMLAYSCRYIVATRDASMGAAEPVMATGTKMESAPEKVNSVLRADMQNRARFFDRNPDIAVAMVDQDVLLVERLGKVEILSSKDQLVQKGENPHRVISDQKKLLTLTGPELVELGVAELLVDPVRLPKSSEKKNPLQYSGKELQLFHQPFFDQIPDPEIDVYQMDWRVRFLSLLTHPAVGSFLVLGMMLGFYMEMSTPGFGLAGSVALICLCLTLLASFALQALTLLEIALMTIGAFLILADLFLIPTFGIMGIIGAILCILGLFGLLIPGLDAISYDLDSATVNAAGKAALQRLAWLCAGLSAGVVAIVGMTYWISPKFSVLNRFVSTGEQQGFTAGALKEQMPSVGATGVAISSLRPSGRIEVENKIFDALSTGRFIEKGDSVVVHQVRGSQVYVQKSKGK